MISPCDRVENIAGKGEMLFTSNIPFFHIFFPKSVIYQGR